MAIASGGGHWIQLLRLLPAFEGHKIFFASTRDCFCENVEGHDFYTVPDASRWNKLKLLYAATCLMKLVFTLKPDVIITTGAAPGLLAVLAGKMLGAKTVWVDSIANVERVSMSGRLATKLANRVYTQWPQLATSKILYSGNVLSWTA